MINLKILQDKVNDKWINVADFNILFNDAIISKIQLPQEDLRATEMKKVLQNSQRKLLVGKAYRP